MRDQKHRGFKNKILERQSVICPLQCFKPEGCSCHARSSWLPLHLEPYFKAKPKMLRYLQAPRDRLRLRGPTSKPRGLVTERAAGSTAGGRASAPHGPAPAGPPPYLLGEPRSARLTMRCWWGEYSHWKAVSVLSSIRNRPSRTYLKITARKTEIFISAGLWRGSCRTQRAELAQQRCSELRVQHHH